MIPYLDTMKSEDRKAYNQNVMEMGHLLRLCDAGITTTTHLQQEMLHYVPEVLINRNTASEEMEKLSDQQLKDKTFEFITKEPPMAVLIKKAALLPSLL